jgi:hypothetical protein
MTSIHLSCAVRHEEYVALGITDDIAARAANEGPLCCIPKPPSPEELGEGPRGSGHIFAPLDARQRLALVALLAAPVAVWVVIGWALVGGAR